MKNNISGQDWRTVGSISRALRIVTLFTLDHPEWSFAELRKHLQLPKTTIFRILKTLEQEDFLRYEAMTARYRLGSALVPCLYALDSHSALTALAHPILLGLVEATGETANITLPVGDKALVADLVMTPHPFRPDMPVGRILDDLGNASSKVLAAFKSPDEIERLLSLPQERLTPHTVIDPAEIRRMLARIREEGVAYDLEEQVLGSYGVATPVFDRSGSVRAAITLVAPKERIKPGDLSRFVYEIRAAAERLSSLIGNDAAATRRP